MAIFLASSGALALTALVPLPNCPTVGEVNATFDERRGMDDHRMVPSKAVAEDPLPSAPPRRVRVDARTASRFSGQGSDAAGFERSVAAGPSSPAASDPPREATDGPPSPWPHLTVVSAAFERLFRARGRAHEDLLRRMLDVPPELILEASLSGYQRHGNADRLDLAVRMLGTMGRQCLPALFRIANIADPGQSAFVELVAHADFITHEERARLLIALGRSPDFDTREKVLHITQHLNDNEVAIMLLRVLSRDQDTSLAEEARSRLSECDASA
jgi:hypothetical protein